MSEVKISELPALGTPLPTGIQFEVALGGTSSSVTLDDIFNAPFISDFTNATHDHSVPGKGGQLDNTALQTGQFTAITGLGTQLSKFDMGGLEIESVGFMDIDEFVGTISPPSPNEGRLFVQELLGTTTLFFIDSLGATTNLLDPTSGEFLPLAGGTMNLGAKITFTNEGTGTNPEIGSDSDTQTITIFDNLDLPGILFIGSDGWNLEQDGFGDLFLNTPTGNQNNKFTILSSSGSFALNSTVSGNDFLANLVTIQSQAGTTVQTPAFRIETQIQSSADVGNQPVIALVAQQTLADVSTRSLLGIFNQNTEVWTVDNDGTITQTGDLVMSSNVITFETNVSVQSSGNDLQLDVNDGGSIIFRENDNPEYTFSDTEADFKNNDLVIGTGNIIFADSESKIFESGSSMFFEISGGFFEFTDAGSKVLDMTPSTFILQNSDIKGVQRLFMNLSEENRLQENSATLFQIVANLDLQYNLGTGGEFSIIVAGSGEEYSFTTTTADFKGNNLSTVGFIDLEKFTTTPGDPADDVGRVFVEDFTPGTITAFGSLTGTTTGYEIGGETVTLEGGTGSGATATVVIDGAGEITSITLVDGGIDFLITDTLTIRGDISDTATATVPVSTITPLSMSLFFRDDVDNITNLLGFLPIEGGTMSGDIIMGSNALEFEDATHLIHQHGTNLDIHVGGGNQVRIVIGTSEDFTYQFGTTNANWNERGIIDMGQLNFGTTGQTNVFIKRGATNTNNLELSAPAVGAVAIQNAGSDLYTFSSSIATFDNPLDMGDNEIKMDNWDINASTSVFELQHLTDANYNFRISSNGIDNFILGATASAGLVSTFFKNNIAGANADFVTQVEGDAASDPGSPSTIGVMQVEIGTTAALYTNRPLFQIINADFGTPANNQTVFTVGNDGSITQTGSLNLIPTTNGVLPKFETRFIQSTPSTTNIFQWVFKGENDQNVVTEYGVIQVKQLDIVDTQEAGSIQFDIQINSELKEFMSLNGETSKLALAAGIGITFPNDVGASDLKLETTEDSENQLKFNEKVVKTDATVVVDTLTVAVDRNTNTGLVEINGLSHNTTDIPGGMELLIYELQVTGATSGKTTQFRISIDGNDQDLRSYTFSGGSSNINHFTLFALVPTTSTVQVVRLFNLNNAAGVTTDISIKGNPSDDTSRLTVYRLV